ncbi:unnamed protein product [Wickerhamomyces anomalus]
MPTQKLLPLVSGSSNQPNNQNSSIPKAFNIKIPLEIQQKLINSNSNLKIIVSKGELQLNINGQIYKLNKLQEYSKVDLYKQFSNSTFKSIGTIHSKLTISQTSTPPTLIASGTKISAITKKLVHLLALGPISIEDMVQRTKVSKNDVESVLRSISMVYSPQKQKQIINKYPYEPEKKEEEGEVLYVLNYSNYKELRLNDWKYSMEELKQIKENCKAVYNHLNYPSSHPARLVLDPKEKELKSETQRPTEPKREPKVEPKGEPKGEPKSESNGTIPEHKIDQPIRKEPVSLKRKRSDEEDIESLQNLAKKFKSKYKEYETLYKEIIKNPNHEIKLTKLYQMHKDLEVWKKQLWNYNDNNNPIIVYDLGLIQIIYSI